MSLDVDSCYQALTARDARFDGLFFVGVATTGIYCRPVCTARLPRRDRCSFYPSAAEAEHAGFRACFRCRPELAPGHASVDSVPRLVASASARIDAGYLNDHSVEQLAAELGVAARHLRRSVQAVLGVSPAELAQSRRLALAKQLLHDTDLRLAEVALASGFNSIRRFNAAFRATFGSAPSALRRSARPAGRGITLRLGYRAPLDWRRLLGFLRARAVPGIEDVGEDVYRRTVAIGDAVGAITVTDEPDRASLRVECAPALAGATMAIAARLRALFDLDARPDVIAAALGRDRRLGPLVRARPGLRVPGAFDPFEVAVRAILGQQVTVRGASTLAARLVAALGTALPDDARAFPTPTRLGTASAAEVAAIGMPESRARALIGLGGAVASGALSLQAPGDVEATLAGLDALPGIGPWTAHYVAMRALGWPDAYPSGDLVIRRALGKRAPVSAADADRLAEAWRPWRAYAVLHLWTADAERGASP